MPQRELGKRKAQRIDVLHYRQRTWLTWMRWTAIAGCLLVSGIYVGWVLWLDQPSTKPSGARSSQLSTGPLSQVHASFESDCQKCHAADFGIGLSPDSLQLDSSARLKLQANKCGECHKQAHADGGLGHFRDKLARPELDQDCARCHEDHRGRTFAMTQVADATCTSCHSNLASACKAGVQSTLNNSVTDFSAASHGQVFRSLARDTGRVKFNHAEHMRLGQVAEGHLGGFQTDFLPGAKHNRYSSVKLDGKDFVQLQCNDCHQPLKSPDLVRTNSAVPEEGRFYAPVSFEKHCADCHQLTYAGQTSDHVPLPHYASAEEFNRLLSFNLRSDRVKGQVAMAADQVQTDEERKKLPASNVPADFDQAVVADAVQSVFQRCQQCHLKEDVDATEGNALSLALKGKPPELIPARWLQYGLFDHAAHQQIKNCQYCHPGTAERDEATTRKIEELKAANSVGSNAVDQHLVKINSISSCLPCHRAGDLPDDESLNTPEKRKSVLGEPNQPIRVSDDCTLCHRYHWTRPSLQVSR